MSFTNEKLNGEDKEKNKYSCDICNQTFDNTYNLDQHIKAHKEQRIFSCKGCNISFHDLEEYNHNLTFQT